MVCVALMVIVALANYVVYVSPMAVRPMNINWDNTVNGKNKPSGQQSIALDSSNLLNYTYAGIATNLCP